MDIDTKGQPLGEYDLILESYNTLSIAQSALKTDRIRITISASTYFAEEPANQALTLGKAQSWILPEIYEGANPITKIEFTASSRIASSLTFNEEAREVSFNGNLKLGSQDRDGICGSIQIDLIDTAESIISYSQLLIVHADPD